MPKSKRAAGGSQGPPPGTDTMEKLNAWVASLRAVQEPVSEALLLIQRLLDRLRESHDVLQESGARKLQHSSEKLQEVSSATESAAMDIMDGVGRALELVDRIEGEQTPSATTSALRDELFGIMNLLQFQDITTQQLQYTSSVLGEMEGDLVAFVERLGELGFSAPAAPRGPRPGPATFDPEATMDYAETRQAAADALIPEQEAVA